MERTKVKERTKNTLGDGLNASQTVIETVSGNDIEYFKNRVYEVLEDYRNENNIDSLTSLKQLQWNSVLMYIGNHVFRINGNRVLNYRDINLLFELVNLYTDICNSHNKTISIVGFSYFSSIDDTILYKWEKQTNRDTIYYDTDTNTLIDSTGITLYRINKPTHNIIELSNNAYSRLVKKIRVYREEQLRNKTEDGSIPSLALGKIEYAWIEGGDKQLQAKLIESYIAPSNLLDKYE